MYSDRPFVIYLAGKMGGLTKQEMNYWRTDLSQKIFRLIRDTSCRDVKIVNPVEFYNTEEQKYKTDKEYVRWELRSAMNADLVVADASDSIGTMAEVTAAHLSGKPIVLYKRDNEGSIHPFMEELADRVFDQDEMGALAEFIYRYYIKI